MTLFALHSPRPMRKSLRVLAALLSYPDALHRSVLSELGAVLQDERAVSAPRRQELAALIERLQRTDPLQAESDYV